jgi:DNA (cytosine-5)-methyltransferase 1
LFSGAGGLTAGFRAAGYEVSFAIDIDHDSCETYARNNPGVDVENRSITDLSATSIAQRSGGDVDVVLGGPSCQGFSTHGRRTGWVRDDDDRNTLWLRMLDVVQAVKPRSFLMENVPGLVHWREGEFGRTILDEFGKLGYAMSMKILLAADFGVPQRRRRLFIVGIRGKVPFTFPNETHLGGWRRDSLDRWERERMQRGLLQHIPVWDAIADLPLLGATAGSKESDYPEARLTPYARKMRTASRRLLDHEVAPINANHLELIRHVPQGGTWRDVPPHLLPDRFRGMRRTDGTNLLGRLDPALPGYTITTQFQNVTAGCFTHPYEDRALSVREGARIQSFPDRFEFIGSLGSRSRQIGNAVPPLLARVLAEQLAVQLDAEIQRSRSVRRAAQLPAPPPSDMTRARMIAQRKSETKPELELRRALDTMGLRRRYMVDARPLPELRRATDVMFPREKVAVFVDGCFWHGCPDHSRDTKSNTKWWAAKIQKNKDRDADTTKRLRAGGWIVLRTWEHESPLDAAHRVASVVRTTAASRGAVAASARGSAGHS